MGNKRFQFRLRTAFLVMTAAAVLLAAGSLLPPGLRRLSLAVVTIVAGSAVLFLVMWLTEQIHAPYGSPRSLPIGSMLLTSVSVLIVVLVLLPLPAGRGPIQYAAGDATAMFVFNLRVATILVLPFTPLPCGLIGTVRLGLGMPPRFGWLVVAITSYVVAWYLVCTQAFFPTA